MKFKFLTLGFALAALCSCAGHNTAVDRSIGQAEAAKAYTEEAKIEPAQTLNANAKLASAKAFMDQGKEDEAIAMAEQSNLEYRLALATAERDAVKKDDERVEKELRNDVERKLLYQSILDKETSAKEGAK
ncbi:MAG: hypothetical protein MJZ26_14200 [Fibrobacter sp.]|nr:hypothetical protein [Fibrobacter sp.]